MQPKYRTVLFLSLMLTVGWAGNALASTTIAPDEDVMTSGFFMGADMVRGYDADNRATHRVSTPNAFLPNAAETIYITFDPNDFSAFTAAIPEALLTVTSISGGFGADANAVTPFLVSAHAVDTDPIAAITDDTNPTGPIDRLTFFNNNILAPTSSTSIDGFGQYSFDVTDIVNDWIAGSNTVFAIALTGKNDVSGNDFLHGFVNNAETPGSTFLTVTPEPASAALIVIGGMVLAVRRKRR
jgi:hypothetical protein